jgi:uncharacterized membrane protein YgcG
LVAIDFAGSGHSEGDYVTLGWHEQHDVGCVVRYLTQERKFKKVALWGRSMGSVSAMMFAQNDMYHAMRPCALVLDSPFSSFPQLVDDLIKKGAIRVPRFAIKTILSMVRSSVKKRTGADIYKIDAVSRAPHCKMPSLFVTADRDEMVPQSHGKSLDGAWGGPSLQVTFHGGHNSPRPPHIYDAAGTFIRQVLAEEDSSEDPLLEKCFKKVKELCCDDPAGPLPPGWLSATDPDTGDVYYYDLYTHKTTWFRPFKPSVGYVEKTPPPTEPFADKTRETREKLPADTNPPKRREGSEFGSFSGFGSPNKQHQVSASEGGGSEGGSGGGGSGGLEPGEVKAGVTLPQEDIDNLLASFEGMNSLGDEEDEDEEHTIHFGDPPDTTDSNNQKPPPTTDTNDAASVNLSIW